VLSDNGNGYRSHAWAEACDELGIARRYIGPGRPQTNGKAEALVDAAPRVGVPLRLPHERPPGTSARRLPALVQAAPTAELARRPTRRLAAFTGPWVPQLIWSEVCQEQALEGPQIAGPRFVGGESAPLLVDAVVAADMRGSDALPS
jgi:hypothetical protein